MIRTSLKTLAIAAVIGFAASPALAQDDALPAGFTTEPLLLILESGRPCGNRDIATRRLGTHAGRRH
jgi:hypothetical protein